MHAAEEKQALRTKLRGRMKEFAQPYLEASDREICRRVLELPEWQSALRIFLYHSVGREVDTVPLIRAALAAGKTVALPKCGTGGQMSAYCINSLEELVPGAFGIPEPPMGERLASDAADLVLVPAVAFDKKGYRLGQGGGYYDRWLQGFNGISVGLCRQALLQEKVPLEKHDCAVSFVVTESGILRP